MFRGYLIVCESSSVFWTSERERDLLLLRVRIPFSKCCPVKTAWIVHKLNRVGKPHTIRVLVKGRTRYMTRKPNMFKDPETGPSKVRREFTPTWGLSGEITRTCLALRLYGNVRFVVVQSGAGWRVTWPLDSFLLQILVLKYKGSRAVCHAYI